MNKLLWTVIGLSSCLSTASCVSVLPDPEPANAIYRLHMTPEKIEPNAAAPIVRIDKPIAARLLGSRKIIVSPDAQRLAVASGAEWSDILPNLIQNSLIDRLATRADLNGVLPSAGARSDFRVHLNVDNFEARFDNGTDNAPLVIVSYSVTFADTETRRLLGTRQFNQSVRAESERVSSIVKGMTRANELAMDEMIVWMAELTQKA